MLLPIIELHKSHYEVSLEGWTRTCFYIHRLVGWVLVSFLIAGLTGLIKT
jgi:succinate dehydrogenase/fumarate reductase cytochrome b subunit